MSPDPKHFGNEPDDEDDDDPFASPDEEDDAGDDMPDIDRQIRINELKERARELAGGQMSEGTMSSDLPPEIEEQFWEQVVAFESAAYSTGFDKLEKMGIHLPEPSELTDEELPAKLEEIYKGMATLGMFLLHTDHLSDRKLYETLYEDVLEEESPDMPPGMGGAWMVDLVSSGSDEDNEAYLKYYADEDYRERWHRDFPEDVIPPHEELPYQRDKKLPQPGGSVEE